MKEMKRILALVLCFVMLVGLVPPAEALVPKQTDKSYSSSAMKLSGSVIDAAIFCSDVHGNPETVTSVFKGIQSMDSTFTPTTAAFVGDTQCVASSVTTAAQKVFSNVECIYAFGNHDDEKGNTSIPDFTGLSYGDEDTNYYIYTISESSMGSSNPDTTGFTTTVAGLDKTKPLFIISHLPLHERRGDSNGAPAWYAAISAAAKEMDIFFFWAHNHTNESEVDRAAYYVPNDGTESMIIEYGDGEAVYPNFTYANAGYIDPPNTPKRNNVATAVYIYSDHVDLVVCNEDGVLTGNYAVDVTVDRLFADKETEETTPVVDRLEAVSNKETYYQGEELDLTVCEVYTNGDKVPVEGYTVSGFDSYTLGAQTVTVTYGNMSTTVNVKVVEKSTAPELTRLKVTCNKEVLLGQELVLQVVAFYSDGSSRELSKDEYTVSGYESGAIVNGVVVTYQTQSVGFNVVTHKDTDVTVLTNGMSSLTVADVTDAVDAAVAEQLEAGFLAFDINPDSYGESAVVSMPAPEGANAVFYWNQETNQLEDVEDVTIVDGKAYFTTDHFSTYVAGTKAAAREDLGWVTLREILEESVGYNYTKVNTLTDNESYAIVSGTSVLMQNGDLSAVQTVEINGNTIASNVELHLWKFVPNGDTYYVMHGQDNLRSKNGVVISTHLDGAVMNVVNVDGDFQIIQNKGYLYSNGNGWYFGTGTNVVSLYQYEGSEIGGTVNGLYGRLEGSTTYQVYTGTSVVDVEQQILSGITAYITNDTTTEGTELNDSELILSMDYSNQSPVGTYTCTVSYNDNSLGHTVCYELGKVTVKAVEKEKETVTVPGTSVTTKVSTPVTVYKKVTTPVSGKTYLIVNSADGNGYGLDGDTTGYETTAFTGGADYYSAWDNASQSGTAFAVGSDVYLTTSGAYLWTAGSNSFTIGYDRSSSNNTGGLGGGTYSYTLNPANKTASWTLANAQLTINLQTAYKGLWGNDTYADFYLTNSGSTWGMATSGAANVYFYEPVTIYKVTETTTGTQEATYGIDITVNGTAASTMNANNVVSGDTVQLGTAFTSTVSGQQPSGGTYTWSTTTNNGVASVDANGLVTFTGKAGTETVKVSYTWTVDDTSYTIFNTLVITTTAMSYSMNIVEENATVKIGAELTLTLETKNSAGNAVTAENVTWTSANETIATVTNGVVTGVKEGSTTITAEWTDPAGKKHTDTVVITVVDAVYTLDLWTHDGTAPVDEITAPVAIKGVENGDTYSVWAVIKADGEDIGALENPEDIQWESSDTSVATVDQTTGIITFTGKEGTVKITATYQKGNKPSDTITISATPSQYTIPSDGTSDFPEYPNEGAIRFDKTATAVGNFSETGIAKLELSMTGVPYTTGSELDVVIMLDQSTSMGDTRIAATVAATKAFIQSIVINEDGSYNGNRIYVGYFNGSKTYDITDSDNIGGDLASIDSKTELDALFASIDDEFDGSPTSSGTQFAVALKKCYDRLNTAKTDSIGNNRQQFCVFMSDGVPTTYQYGENAMHGSTSSTNQGYTDMKGMFTGTNYDTRSSSYVYEYYSTEMKKNGVTVYTVGLGLEAKNNAWSSASATQCLNAASLLLNDIAGPAKETNLGTGSDLNKKDSYFFSVEDATAAADMKDVFEHIAMKILQAATDVTVEDKITDHYTMIFDIPTGDMKISGVDNDFYIEFGKYALDENHERTEDGFTSVTKLYLTNTNGTLSAKDSTAPVFEQKTIGDKGTLYYWSTNAADGDAGISVTVSGTTYYFVSYGMEEAGYNMTSGAYANGKVDSVTNMSTDLIIATPYFVYNASTKMIYWTVDKLDTTEYVLRYFLYLDNSATEVGVTGVEVDPGSYLTNDHAYITYTNFQNVECRREFPKPQLTWSGAQVSYVFYLVNAQGQPINKSGQVVDFANATFVTEVYTEDTVWNKGQDGQITADSQLSIDWLAEELLPSDYKVYDEKASYKLHVYGSHTGESIFDYFTIGGNDAATISASLYDRLGLTTTTASVETTKVYNTKAGTKYDDYGTYTSEATDSLNNETVLDGFDFYNTTVAFAVVWQPSLAPDTVVVDYGLDVLINVTFNDLMQDNTISGIGLSRNAYGIIAENTGISTNSLLGKNDLTTADGSTIHLENDTQIRFSQNDMTFNAPVTFYYESAVKYYEGSEQKNGFLHTSVTVIPATTIYYEDDFISFTSYTADESGKFSETADEECKWVTSVQSGVQEQDRPGTTLIAGVLDANNNYGFDKAYETMSQHSMGSAAQITVNAATRGEATFTFWGTGFDVISLTSGATGSIIVEVFEGASATGTAKQTSFVDTFYGMKADGSLSANTPDTIYQVPVIKVDRLTYGQYTVKITAGWNQFFDHTPEDGQYTLYLDAIRIYDPTGNQNDTANDAYKADGEAFPRYQELRNNVISAEGVTTSTDANGTVTVNFPTDDTFVRGAIFIDCNDAANSIQNYVSYGPNNELYLAPGQAIAFNVTVNSNVADIQLGMKVANGDSVVYQIGGKEFTLKSTTDMYYSIKDYAMNKDGASTTVVITNTSGGILSLTNIKVTYKADPGAVTDLLWIDEAGAAYALMSLRKAPVVEEPAVPETTVPEVTEPETTEPEATEPETTEPETTEPETTEPEVTEPETTEPEETEPGTSEKVEELIQIVKKIVRKIFGRIFG